MKLKSAYDRRTAAVRLVTTRNRVRNDEAMAAFSRRMLRAARLRYAMTVALMLVLWFGFGFLLGVKT